MPTNYRPKHLSREKESYTNPRAACTGGLRSPNGRGLTLCRSGTCPAHTPKGYARYGARHRDLSPGEWPSLGRFLSVYAMPDIGEQ